MRAHAHDGTLPSCQSPSKKVQSCDQSRHGRISFTHAVLPAPAARAIRPSSLGDAEDPCPFSSSMPTALCSMCTPRSRASRPRRPDAERFSEIWRTKQLEYTWTLTLAGHYADFWTLTERALDFALARVPSVRQRSSAKLLDAYFKLDAFPDARAALRALKAEGPQDRHSLQRLARDAHGAVDAAGIGDDLDAVLSVDVLKMFKPRPEVYRPCHRPFRLQARRRDLRLLEPLGRDGGRLLSASTGCGSTAAKCRTSIWSFRPSRWRAI